MSGDTLYSLNVIKNYRHKGLERFRETGNGRGFDAKLAKRLHTRLDLMNAATSLDQMNRVGWDLHLLKGDRAGTWSISVNGPWRITFLWNETTLDCQDVDLEQYHDKKIRR